MFFKQRSSELELMDLGPAYYTMDEYYECLKTLGVIGSLLGGDSATLKAFQNLKEKPQSILDVGCGGGAFTIKLAKCYSDARVVGIDINEDAITYAKKHSYDVRNISFEYSANPELNAPDKSFDIVTATLVCHHLNDEQLINFFIQAKRIARKAIIINDLHRHIAAYILFKLISPLIRNRLAVYDGLISIKRSFKKAEIIGYLKSAGISENSFSIYWHWAFRWVIVIKV